MSDKANATLLSQDFANSFRDAKSQALTLGRNATSTSVGPDLNTAQRCPAKLKQQPIHMPGGSRTACLACALFEQETVVRATETVVRATVAALFEFIAKQSELDSKMLQRHGMVAEHVVVVVQRLVI